MLLQVRVNAPDRLLKVYDTIVDLLQQGQRGRVPQYLPREPRGGHAQLSAAAVVTRLVWGAWRGRKRSCKRRF